MLRKLYKVEFSVPLGVGIKVAEHWGEGDEEKHNGAMPWREGQVT